MKQSHKCPRFCKHVDVGYRDNFNTEAHWYAAWSGATWAQQTLGSVVHCIKDMAPSVSERQVALPVRRHKLRISEYETLCKVFNWQTREIDSNELLTEWQRRDCSVLNEVRQTCLHNAADASSHCIVCFDSHACLHGADCGHAMCITCWGKYAEASISQGNFDIRCPATDCRLQAPEAVLKCVLSESLSQKFQEGQVGCNHMVCRQCHMHFCWACGQFGESISTYHRSPCMPKQWHMPLAHIVTANIVESWLVSLETAERLLRISTALQSSGRFVAASSLGYSPNLSIKTVLKVESALLEGPRGSSSSHCWRAKNGR